MQALLAAAPVETTALLMDLCLQNPSDPSAYVANLAEFTHLYADRCGAPAWPNAAGVACAAAVSGGGGGGAVWQNSRASTSPTSAARLPCAVAARWGPGRDVAVPVLLPSGFDDLIWVLASLLCRPDDLRYACVAILNMNPDSPSRQTLYHTLLDLYLSPGNPPGGGSSGGAGAGATSTAAGGGGGGGGEARSGSNQEGAGAAAAAAGERQQSGAAASSSSSSSSSSQQEALDLLK